MSYYLNINNVPGNVTADGHQGWIELVNYQFTCRRTVNTYTGCGADRVSGNPVFGDVHITKKIDKSSPRLFQHFVKGKSIGEITLDCCHSSDVATPYQQIILDNVIITDYVQDSEDKTEYISFDFTKIHTTFTSTNAEHQFDAPISSGFNIATAEIS